MMGSNSAIRLLPREALLTTGPVDHADWNHKLLLGWIQRLRFRMILSLLPRSRVHRLLEIGYGSGVFMPTLVDRCDELYGIDQHRMHREVSDVLQGLHLSANLISGTAEQMPFPDGYFDVVIGVSSIEFIDNLEAACLEIRRVLRSDGCLVMVTPGHSPLVDLGLKLLTGKSAASDYGDRRQLLMTTLEKHFTIQTQRTAPAIGSSIVCLYTALRLLPRAGPLRPA